VPNYVQEIIIGAIIVGAVLIDQQKHRLRARSTIDEPPKVEMAGA